MLFIYGIDFILWNYINLNNARMDRECECVYECILSNYTWYGHTVCSVWMEWIEYFSEQEFVFLQESRMQMHCIFAGKSGIRFALVKRVFALNARNAILNVGVSIVRIDINYDKLLKKIKQKQKYLFKLRKFHST